MNTQFYCDSEKCNENLGNFVWILIFMNVYFIRNFIFSLHLHLKTIILEINIK